MFLCIFFGVFLVRCLHPSVFDILTEWRTSLSQNPEILTELIKLRIMDIISFLLNKSSELPNLGF